MGESKIVLTQMGFVTGAKEKRAYLLCPGQHRKFILHSLETSYISGEKKNKQIKCIDILEGDIEIIEDDFGSIGIMDFSSVNRPGLYQVIVDGKRSHPFFIRKDLYLRTAYEAYYYSHIQRCGCAVEGWHDACHLDDAVRDDTGEHMDCVGGWHDAGDLRKWMNHTMWHAIGMLWLKKTWGIVWSHYADDDILDELKWGNQYYLKMQDPKTNLVWTDVGGDEKDNTWTDNVVGTGDDRVINTNTEALIQWKFSWLQAMIAKVFNDKCREQSEDQKHCEYEEYRQYSEKCLQAGIRTYEAISKTSQLSRENTLTVACAALAASELYKAFDSGIDSNVYKDNKKDKSNKHYLADVQQMIEILLSRQENMHKYGQKLIRGFFYNDNTNGIIFNDWWQASLLPFALISAMDIVPVQMAKKIKGALKLYIDEYIVPLSNLNAFRVIPVNVVLEKSSHDHYRKLEGDMWYRYFLPVLSNVKQPKTFIQYGQGTNTHLLGNAAVLFHCYHLFGVEEYRHIGLKQLEWVHGANPFGVCMVTGRGVDTLFPHSRYLGLIPGAIVNGISGDETDDPHLGGFGYEYEWQTVEYWSPTQAQYLMSVCGLHPKYSTDTDVGVRKS